MGYARIKKLLLSSALGEVLIKKYNNVLGTISAVLVPYICKYNLTFIVFFSLFTTSVPLLLTCIAISALEAQLCKTE